ncbi:hypothetical protein H310_09111 [Aphanomyces invadans]|uniref:UDENN domain-containing protein n=1 Tax=Aphanomyces invadans TaxID=157072 RepID=A0A024TVU3_9STRA|nr:hypothetical protein H310_09111 [Aphanomyces invadans]ETV97746.1 hypothetical protein H310_09111 [Aphanomyces invadans]|eukprot:XP_008873307.1 hypothetical protein H310_09111 [Aphanomyces invadans]
MIASSPCNCASTWQAQWEEAVRACEAASMEASEWKRKFLAERDRRRELSRALIYFLEQDHTSACSPMIHKVSTMLSDSPDTAALLTPTLPSFDIDYDDDDESTDEDVAAASKSLPSTSISTSRQLYHPVMLSMGGAAPQEGRPTRSSTIDSASRPNMFSPRHRFPGGDKDHNQMIRMLYSRSFVGGIDGSPRHIDAHSRRLHDLVRSMTCFQTKKDRVFEHFLVSGLLAAPGIAPPGDGQSDKLCGWKPRVLFQYPPSSIHPINDQAVSSFCFPVGVPAFSCTATDAVHLQDHLVSQWTVDVPSTLRQLLDPHNAQCYTFRLTGCKGEALYGFCAAILMDASEPPILLDNTARDNVDVDAHQPATPPGSPTVATTPMPATSRAAGATDRAIKFHSQAGILASPLTGGKNEDVFQARGAAAEVLISPRCYCITSKYPLYKLHFQVLRLVIEADMETRREARAALADQHTHDIDVVLTGKDLGITLCERNGSVHCTRDPHARAAHVLNSIATKQGGNDAEKNTIAITEMTDDRPMGSLPNPKPPRTRHFVRSHSWTEMCAGSKQTRPLGTPCGRTTSIVVHACTAAASAAGVTPGDALHAVNGFPLNHMAFGDVLQLLESSKRPLKLGLRRKLPSAHRHNPNDRAPSEGKKSPTRQATSSSAVLELLRRFRGMPVVAPGAWSSARLPHSELKYQFPVDPAATDNWAVVVLLRLLSAPTVVKVVSCLLLEKQVAVVSDSTAKLSVVNTALVVLLRPFQWQSTFIPILPSNLLDFLHSPVPYLVGVHSAVVSMEEWPDVCFVHVESDSMQCPYSSLLLSFPRANDLTKLLHDASANLRSLPPRPGQPWHEVSDAEHGVLAPLLPKASAVLANICGNIASIQLPPPTGDQSTYDVLQDQFHATVVRGSLHPQFLAEFAQTQLFCQYCEVTMNLAM